jgi:iron complex transport system substrate-binding protein
MKTMSKQKIKLCILLLIFFSLLSIGYIVLAGRDIPTSTTSIPQKTTQSTYPVTVESCGKPITFESKPKRAMAFDTNMVEIMLALGLENEMVGYWISGVPVGKEYQEKIKNIPLVSEKTWPPPGMELVLSFNPDFVFGAWNYNFGEESGVTPEKLENAGVKSYVLTESCIAVGVHPTTTLESTYQDIMNIGIIFDKKDRAQALVDQMRANIENTQKTIGEVKTPLRGLYYGGGTEAAFSAGKYGMASKIMSAVGARNILSDVEDDWIPKAGWETIIERDPEFIMIDDTPWESAEHRIATLQSLPQLAGITAIREKRFIVLPWTYILPGMEMDKGIAMLAKNLYSDRFK